MPLETVANISLDMSRDNLVVVHAKQYDDVRKIRVELFDNGEPWYVPNGNTIIKIVSYKKSIWNGGFYDRTQSGEIAVTVDSSDRHIITIAISRPMVTEATTVGSPCKVDVTFYDTANGNTRLSSFSFDLIVEPSAISELDLKTDRHYDILAQEIAAVLDASTSMTGLTAQATTLAAGSSATATVTGGSSASDPYLITFGIPQGVKGNTGSTATPTSTSYANADSTTIPSNPATLSWVEATSQNVLQPIKGHYYWTRSTTTWSNNTTTISYAVSYIGVDGGGSTASEIATTTTGVTVQDALNTLGQRINTADTNILNLDTKHTIRKATAANLTIPRSRWALQSTPDVSAEFPYRAYVTVNDVTANMFSQVVFSVEDAMSGEFAPVSKSDVEKIYIYAANIPSGSITLLSAVAIL